LTTYTRRVGPFSANVVVEGILALAPTGTCAQFGDSVAFGDWIFFGLIVAGRYRLRARDAGAARGALSGAELLVPGYPWTPALFVAVARFVAVACFVVASLVLANSRNTAIATGFLLLGIPVHLWWSRRALASVGSGEGGTT
jgi:hypothetical protein